MPLIAARGITAGALYAGRGGHYKLVCCGGIRPFTTRGIWGGLIPFGNSDLGYFVY